MAAFPTLEADNKRTVERIESGPVRLSVRDPRNGKATPIDLLASDDASYLTGSTLYPDGGRLALNYVM